MTSISRIVLFGVLSASANAGVISINFHQWINAAYANTPMQAGLDDYRSDVAPLTSDSITLTLDTLYGGGAGLAAIQLVGPARVPLAISHDGSGAPQLSLEGLTDQPYEIETSTALSPGSWGTPSWGSISAPTSDGTIVVDDTDSPYPGTKFYRAAEVRP